MQRVTRWTPADSKAAMRDGWDIWEKRGASLESEIEREDAKGRFDDSDAATRHVLARAAEGSALHVKAVEYIRITSPREFDRIMQIYQCAA